MSKYPFLKATATAPNRQYRIRMAESGEIDDVIAVERERDLTGTVNFLVRTRHQTGNCVGIKINVWDVGVYRINRRMTM